MNTTIGKSFGHVLLMAIGVVVTMLALGMFSVKPASAGLDVTTVDVTPATARSIAQYTITVTGASGDPVNAINVGDTITVKFNTSTGVPSSIAASAVKLKTTQVLDGSDGAAGDPNQLRSASAITVSGKSVTITVPDMDPGDGAGSIGDNGIAGGTGASYIIIFTQAAGIQNPNTQKEQSVGYTLEVSSTGDTTADTSVKYAINATVSFSPSTAARGATLTVTGRGFAKNCADCKIRFNPQNSVTPTTGAEGSGTIDADGVFAGTVVLDASTNQTGWFIWVVDSTGFGKTATATWTQDAGANPRVTSATPGSTVKVDLVDYTSDFSFGTTGNVQVGSDTNVTNTALALSGSDTSSLTPFKFLLPTTTPTGTHKVTIDENGSGKTASFNLEVISRVLTVTPNPASPGQSITISGTGFAKTSGKIAQNALTASSTGGGSANVNRGGEITIDGSGDWSFATTMPTKEVFIDTSSESVTFTATDSDSLVGKSSGFKRTPRTLTLSPAEVGPGSTVIVTVTGLTVDNGTTADVNASFAITSSDTTNLKFIGTISFPIGSDGSGTGTITIANSSKDGTYTLTAKDNAPTLYPNASGAEVEATTQQQATASIKIPKGTVTVDPASASTGQFVTVTGVNFPANTTGTTLTFDGANGIPVGGFTTDTIGSFSVLTEVPPQNIGGSLTPGTKIVEVVIGTITGNTTAFAVPNPMIILTPAEAEVEGTVVITGTGFNSLGTVSTLTIGDVSVIPSPAPRAARNGDITATITIPLLNPGSYTVVMINDKDGNFTATATFTALAAKAPAAAATDATETIFADVIANDDNLVRVWRFSNAEQSWAFYDPRPAFAAANTLTKSGAGDIVWVNVTAEQEFQGATLFPGWNLISLK